MTTTRAGVSLIELIVVLLLFSFLLGLVVPAMTALPDRRTGASQADSARGVAVRTGRLTILPATDSVPGMVALPDGRSLGGGGSHAQ